MLYGGIKACSTAQIATTAAVLFIPPDSIGNGERMPGSILLLIAGGSLY